MYPYNYQNPYQMNQQPPQPYQPNFQPMVAGGLKGRVVADFDLITANDVPMDGGYAIFPKADMSEVQIRKWSPNGQIERTTYKAISEPIEAQTSILSNEYIKSEFEDVRGQIDALRDDVTKMCKQMWQSNKPTQNKKDGAQ